MHERYRQTTDRRTDGRRHIANVNVSSRSFAKNSARGKISVRCRQILITSSIHLNTYSYQVFYISFWSRWSVDRQTHGQKEKQYPFITHESWRAGNTAVVLHGVQMRSVGAASVSSRRGSIDGGDLLRCPGDDSVMSGATAGAHYSHRVTSSVGTNVARVGSRGSRFQSIAASNPIPLSRRIRSFLYGRPYTRIFLCLFDLGVGN